MLHDAQFRKVVPGVGDNGEDLHTAIGWHELKPGDKVVGMGMAEVKSVKPLTEYGDPVKGSSVGNNYDVHWSHPEHGEWLENRRGHHDRLAVYRKPAKGKSA